MQAVSFREGTPRFHTNHMGNGAGHHIWSFVNKNSSNLVKEKSLWGRNPCRVTHPNTPQKKPTSFQRSNAFVFQFSFQRSNGWPVAFSHTRRSNCQTYFDLHGCEQFIVGSPRLGAKRFVAMSLPRKNLLKNLLKNLQMLDFWHTCWNNCKLAANLHRIYPSLTLVQPVFRK